MKYDQFEEPVSVQRPFRVVIGVIFIFFSALFGHMAIWFFFGLGEKVDLSFASVSTVLSISIGYIGYRLIAISNDERLLGHKASFVAAFMLVCIAAALLLTGSNPVHAVTSFVMALVLFRSARKSNK